MSEYPHYNIWLGKDGTFTLPDDYYAALLFDGTDDNGRYNVYTCELGSRQCCIFRHLQHLKHLKRSRSLPTSLVIKVGFALDMPDYHRNAPPAPEGGWTEKINWNSVLKALIDEAREMFPLQPQE